MSDISALMRIELQDADKCQLIAKVVNAFNDASWKQIRQSRGANNNMTELAKTYLPELQSAFSKIKLGPDEVLLFLECGAIAQTGNTELQISIGATKSRDKLDRLANLFLSEGALSVEGRLASAEKVEDVSWPA